ncbi:MAG: flagellar assembly protein FliH [Pseudomonas sp.]|nr:flagellar assembly protein FliH [Pseudomonas sp.]
MSDKKFSSELIRLQAGDVLNVWDLPSFDHPSVATPATTAETEVSADSEHVQVQVEEVIAEDVKPLTLADVEAVRQDAWNEGFSTGEKDGFHAGQLKAAQEAQDVLTAKVAALDGIMQQFFEPIAQQDQQLEEAMLDLITRISKQVIQRELSLDSSQIKQVVRESLKLLPASSDVVRVYINPQDFEQIKALRERHEENWKIIEDDDLLPGGCRFESVNTRIDASIETRIEHIAQQFLEQQRELQTNPLDADLQIPTELPVEPQASAPLETVEPIDPVLEDSPVDPETTP